MALAPCLGPCPACRPVCVCVWGGSPPELDLGTGFSLLSRLWQVWWRVSQREPARAAPAAASCPGGGAGSPGALWPHLVSIYSSRL